MNPAVAFKRNAKSRIIEIAGGDSQNVPGRPAVLIAAVDPEIRRSLAGLLRNYSVNAVWVDSVEAIKSVIANASYAACFCALWLQDGTYREIVRHFRRERIQTPVVIVSTPESPIGYRDSLAAMNIGALDCLCYPYEQSNFEAILESAIATQTQGAGMQGAQNESALSGAA